MWSNSTALLPMVGSFDTFPLEQSEGVMEVGKEIQTRYTFDVKSTPSTFHSLWVFSKNFLLDLSPCTFT